MPLSPRSRFVLVALSMVTLLAWPRAISRNDTNVVPFALFVIAVTFIVSLALRAGHARGQTATATDRLAYALEIPVVALTVSAALLCWNRPETAQGERPAAASFGPFSAVYDPCERGDDAVVCSGVARSVGYVCRAGYTVRVARCREGVCTRAPIGAGDRSDLPCEVSR